MKKLIFFIVTISMSGGAGYLIGTSITKKKYEDLADLEVESVKRSLIKYYENKDENIEVKQKESAPKESAPIDIEPTKVNKKPESKIKTDYGKKYRTDTEPERIPGSPGDDVKFLKKEKADTTKPYVIEPSEFADSENEVVTLYYTKDKVLTDDDFNKIDNIGIVGGHAVLEQMGRYDASSLHVRDIKNGVDYEILQEERNFDKLKPLGVV
ncbi:MAG: hypothetical protein ACNA7U_03605 [Candidatus Izemoplasmataceae bacterium]